MAKSNIGGVILIVGGGLLLTISASELSDLIIGSSVLTEGSIAYHILFVLVGILLLWRGIQKTRKGNSKSP